MSDLSPECADFVAKVFWGDNRKFTWRREGLRRFLGKTNTDLRSDVMGLRNVIAL